MHSEGSGSYGERSGCGCGHASPGHGPALRETAADLVGASRASGLFSKRPLGQAQQPVRQAQDMA